MAATTDITLSYIGLLSNLKTTDKSNIVNAINEVKTTSVRHRSANYVDLPIPGPMGTITYTCPSDGYIVANGGTGNGVTQLHQGWVENKTMGGRLPLGGYSYYTGGGQLICQKGDVISIYRENNCVISLARFYPFE